MRRVYVFGDDSAFFAVFKYGVDSEAPVKMAMEFGFGKVMTKIVKTRVENMGVVSKY